jgi:hypothetical protein
MRKSPVRGEQDQEAGSMDIPVERKEKRVETRETKKPTSSDLIKTRHLNDEEEFLNDKEELDKNWPQRVSCKMNFPKWRDALQQNALLPEFQDVLNGLEKGFNQGIPPNRIEDRPYFTPKYHNSAYEAKEKIKKKFCKEIAAKRMYGLFTHTKVQKKLRFFQTSPLGAIINGNGSVRPINDLSFPRNAPNTPSVNSYVQAKDFKTTHCKNFFKHPSAFYNFLGV